MNRALYLFMTVLLFSCSDNKHLDGSGEKEGYYAFHNLSGTYYVYSAGTLVDSVEVEDYAQYRNIVPYNPNNIIYDSGHHVAIDTIQFSRNHYTVRTVDSLHSLGMDSVQCNDIFNDSIVCPFQIFLLDSATRMDTIYFNKSGDSLTGDFDYLRYRWLPGGNDEYILYFQEDFNQEVDSLLNLPSPPDSLHFFDGKVVYRKGFIPE